MLSALDNFFKELKERIITYLKTFKGSKILLIPRLIFFIPTIFLIFVVDFFLLVLYGVKQTFAIPLVEVKKTLIESYSNSNENVSNINIERIVKNYFFGMFEVMILIIIYALLLSIAALMGTANGIFVLLSLSNKRLYTRV